VIFCDFLFFYVIFFVIIFVICGVGIRMSRVEKNRKINLAGEGGTSIRHQRVDRLEIYINILVLINKSLIITSLI